MKSIRFRFSPLKARAALHWMLFEKQTLDLHTILKACYFADKLHLNKHGRPIFGATYRAMKFGPVPLEIYEMAKGDALWLAEIHSDHYPWGMTGHRLHIQANSAPDMRVLSPSDFDALKKGFEQSCSMTFNERTAATHGRDWQAANLGVMQYEDMLDETPEKAEKVAYLREAAPHIRL